ncbi:TetR/AcrR family transcriptional regulator [Agreia sp. Leaf283]|uniref:TetR/AcrR family transcriptional regulator n=1 Tax=Agreia sp. Leaf283 TaxID=1736321 RepID=UPI0006FD6FEF|nr:TetR/AcrR family transcriptional regulator [Agreia sp. Leaf283]KQP57618.1 TetR family transcriptional regulator [Agreia sp. Leaf283]
MSDPGNDTKQRILDVAIDVLGKNPDAGMGEIATAAGVVRRTVYGHFPSRSDLVHELTRRAVEEMSAILADVATPNRAADAEWADFITRLWPLVHRYRVLVALRRGELGADIHSLLGPVDETLAGLVDRGQCSGAFGRHLPADVLSQVAWSGVFMIADSALSRESLDASAAALTSLLMLGVPEARARTLV